MGIDKEYATILGGNPNVSLQAKDAFGTSVASSLPGFQPGGSLYKRAQTTLGDFLNPQNEPTTTTTSQQQQSGQISPQDFVQAFKNQIVTNALTGPSPFTPWTTPDKQDTQVPDYFGSSSNVDDASFGIRPLYTAGL